MQCVLLHIYVLCVTTVSGSLASVQRPCGARRLCVSSFTVTMAIEFLGFTIWVHSDGKELEEYKVQVEDENTVSCYIPSEVGKVRTPPVFAQRISTENRKRRSSR